MKRGFLVYLLGLFFAVILSGCVVRTYPLTRERVDQDITGNRGYLEGEAPAGEEKEKKTTRTTQMVEIEFHSPIKFERLPGPKRAEAKTEEKTQDQTLWGNRGYISASNIPETKELAPVANVEKYTVQKGDTLQKISKKFYGTTKKWHKIYEANQDKLKGPNKIYPGQTIDIPLNTSTSLSVNPKQGQGVEPLKETQENLK
jgi:LysM repeat protein